MKPQVDPDPVVVVRGLGHDPQWDPPAALTSMMGRWTCSRCGRAVIVRRDGTGYGSALERACDVLRADDPRFAEVAP